MIRTVFKLVFRNIHSTAGLVSGKLDHLDYPALAKEKLGITHIEYWNRPFNGKHTNKPFMKELVKRTTGEGMKNVPHFGRCQEPARFARCQGADSRGLMNTRAGWIALRNLAVMRFVLIAVRVGTGMKILIMPPRDWAPCVITPREQR